MPSEKNIMAAELTNLGNALTNTSVVIFSYEIFSYCNKVF
jgi:hypothetical protein